MCSVVLMMALAISADATGCDYYDGYGCYASYACYGCYGGYGYYGGPVGYYGGSTTYAKAPGETDEEFKYCQEKQKELSPDVYSNFRNSVWLRMTNDERNKMMQKEKKGGGSSSLSRRATFVVTLPADASLKIEGRGTTSVGTRRVFISPPLPPDGRYSYTLKAEFVRGGKTVSVTKSVVIVAGKETQISFTETVGNSFASR